MFGNDLNFCDTKTSTPEMCQLLCEETKGCVQFTWLDKTFKDKDRYQSCCMKTVLNRNYAFAVGAITGSMTKCGKYAKYYLYEVVFK